VADAVGGGAGAVAGGSDAAHQAREAHVHPHEPPGQSDAGEVEVGGAHHAYAVDVDELAVEDVTSEHHLAGSTLVVAQVQAGGSEPDVVGVDLIDLCHRDVCGSPTDLGDEPGDGRVRATVPARHEVHDASDLVADLVADGATLQTGE
jgi:hypothetical protein